MEWLGFGVIFALIAACCLVPLLWLGRQRE
jgi:hypothetical protein